MQRSQSFFGHGTIFNLVNVYGARMFVVPHLSNKSAQQDLS